MKKIVFLGDTLLNDEPLGIQRYAYEILKKLDCNPDSSNYELLIPKKSKCSISFRHIRIVPFGNLNPGFLWRQLCFPEYVRKNHAISVDLTLGLSFRGSDIVCLHDCVYENYPQDFIGWKAKLKRHSYLIRARIAVRKAKRIITVSNTSKKELMEHYPIEDSKITVIYNAWQHFNRIQQDDRILSKLHLQEKTYCFSLGSGLPHKNFKWIIMAALENPEYTFVVTGTNRLSKYLSELQIENVPNIIFTGFLSDGEVKALMTSCALFLHPSVYEGFGIPPLEALSCGTKVAVSNLTCLPEIYQDSAVYFDPYQYDNISIDRLIAEVQHLSPGVLKKYDWAKSACLLREIITSL